MRCALSKSEPVIIKKYPNRRLYNTQTSIYIKIEDLTEMVKKNEDFQVIDVKTGQDITRVTLAQILLDLETQGMALLPVELIKTAIKIYDNPTHKLMHEYIVKFIEGMNELGANPLMDSAMQIRQSFEEMHKNNMAYFESLWHNFNPQSDNKKK